MGRQNESGRRLAAFDLNRRGPASAGGSLEMRTRAIGPPPLQMRMCLSFCAKGISSSDRSPSYGLPQKGKRERLRSPMLGTPTRSGRTHTRLDRKRVGCSGQEVHAALLPARGGHTKGGGLLLAGTAGEPIISQKTCRCGRTRGPRLTTGPQFRSPLGRKPLEQKEGNGRSAARDGIVSVGATTSRRVARLQNPRT